MTDLATLPMTDSGIIPASATGMPHRQTVTALVVQTMDGWVKLKDTQGDVAVLPAGAVLSIVRHGAECGQ